MIPINLEGTITKFFPYESVFLQQMILSFDSRDMYKDFQREIEFDLGFDLSTSKWEEVGFKNYCRLAWDNKVTFEFTKRDNTTYYIQFYDGKVNIGLSVAKRNYEPTTHYLKITK